jgi:hypothetical protein
MTQKNRVQVSSFKQGVFKVRKALTSAPLSQAGRFQSQILRSL